MYNNFPVSKAPNSPSKIYDRQFTQPLELDANTFSLMKGFFEKRGFDKSSAETIAVTLIRQATLDDYNPLEVLDTMKKFDGTQLNTVVSELINFNRFKSSYVGSSTAPNSFLPVSRNIAESAGTSAIYTVESSTEIVNEGQQTTFLITTESVAKGTLFYWSLSGTGISGGDFENNILSGTVIIFNNSASVIVDIREDLITEGNEVLFFRLRKRSTNGPVLASASVIINDVSFSAVADYMVIEYTFDTGNDLDTRVRVVQPPLPSIENSTGNTYDYTGWGQGDYIPNILDWGGDNTGTGRESCVFKINDYKNAFPSTSNIIIDCRAQWFGTVGTTPVGLKITLYEGGAIQQVGFGFENPTATTSTVLNLTLKSITLKSTSALSIGDRIATINYNVTTGAGTVNPNDTTVYP